ncbi:MAG TPA: biotin/lipoyl-containing protein, partial [Burkholderiales bacterium]|nr:biotin/lipoyl-containing protein [Burkholderiales bacterium]
MPDTIEVKVPDIGDFKDIPVIEVLVKPGDSIKAEDPLISLESDKATMEVPSPAAGIVKELKLKVGDKVSEGTLVLTLEAQAAQPAAQTQPAAEARPAATPPPAPPTAHAATPPAAPRAAPAVASPTAALGPHDEASARGVHAGPSVRHFARELGVDLSNVAGSGPKNRILREDVQAFVKTELAHARGAAGGGLGFNLPPMPQVDFAKFGSVRMQALSRIKKLSGANLHRNWLSIPHVTQHDEADITELEAFRKSQADEAKKEGIRFTLLAFLIKAVVVALKQ